jgi:hypothetical protein
VRTKLTLRLDEELIRRAKVFARRRGKSVSQMVADYFSALEKKEANPKEDLTPFVQSLKGALRNSAVGVKDYRRHQEDKYLGDSKMHSRPYKPFIWIKGDLLRYHRKASRKE